MIYELTANERAILERIAREEKPMYARRALLLLLQDQGLATKEISPQVGISAGRVYSWLRAFRDRRMGIFPDDLLTVVTPASPTIGSREAAISQRMRSPRLSLRTAVVI